MPFIPQCMCWSLMHIIALLFWAKKRFFKTHPASHVYCGYRVPHKKGCNSMLAFLQLTAQSDLVQFIFLFLWLWPRWSLNPQPCDCPDRESNDQCHFLLTMLQLGINIYNHQIKLLWLKRMILIEICRKSSYVF